MKIHRKPHGHRRNGRSSATYQSWNSMMDRTRRQNRHDRRIYVDVQVCDRWKDFRNFLADMGERPVGCTLDRIDNNLGYSPDNCRWATPKQQQRNRRNNRRITHNGQTQCLVEWSEQLGIRPDTISYRLAKGWSVDRALGLA